MIALCTVATPCVGVVPGTFEKVRKKQILVVGADFDGVILFAADTAMGELLVAFGAGKPSNRREGAAVGTAHDELQYAVA